MEDTLWHLLEWVMEDALPARPARVRIQLNADSLRAEHDGAALGSPGAETLTLLVARRRAQLARVTNGDEEEGSCLEVRADGARRFRPAIDPALATAAQQPNARRTCFEWSRARLAIPPPAAPRSGGSGSAVRAADRSAADDAGLRLCDVRAFLQFLPAGTYGRVDVCLELDTAAAAPAPASQGERAPAHGSARGAADASAAPSPTAGRGLEVSYTSPLPGLRETTAEWLGCDAAELGAARCEREGVAVIATAHLELSGGAAPSSPLPTAAVARQQALIPPALAPSPLLMAATPSARTPFGALAGPPPSHAAGAPALAVAPTTAANSIAAELLLLPFIDSLPLPRRAQAEVAALLVAELDLQADFGLDLRLAAGPAPNGGAPRGQPAARAAAAGPSSVAAAGAATEQAADDPLGESARLLAPLHIPIGNGAALLAAAEGACARGRAAGAAAGPARQLRLFVNVHAYSLCASQRGTATVHQWAELSGPQRSALAPVVRAALVDLRERSGLAQRALRSKPQRDIALIRECFIPQMAGAMRELGRASTARALAALAPADADDAVVEAALCARLGALLDSQLVPAPARARARRQSLRADADEEDEDE
jgi:hypothetical protein